MIQKRLEILKGDTWVEIELFSGTGIKYNNVINKIANTTERSLSHSNTFQVPWTKQNIDALELNIFNKTRLANALNEKYEAKYYVDNELLQVGFVVVNNMNDGVPSLNFIDEALSLVELWGSTTYKEFLRDDILLENVSDDYVTAIDEMKNYNLDPNGVLDILGNINGESFPIAYFPNTINCIGDKFQLDADENRALDKFNPYQTRPMFNVQAFLNMVTEAYGYTLIKHNSIDWDKVSNTVITSKGLAQGEIDEGTTTGNYYTVSFNSPHKVTYNSVFWYSQVSMKFPGSIAKVPNFLNNFPTSPDGLNTPAAAWFQNEVLFVPNISGGYTGDVRFLAQHEIGNNAGNLAPITPIVKIVYSHNTLPNQYIIEDVVASVDNSTESIVDFTFSKTQFESPSSSDAGAIVGIYLLRSATNNVGGVGMQNMTVTEDVLASDVVTYDDYGQIQQIQPDLTYAAPTKTIKDIVNGILQRFGALIDINTKKKEIEIFTYKIYGDNRYNGQFLDWSEYHQQYVNPNFNTNYGNTYAVKNSIGLNGPYVGNSVDRYLGNQVLNSKLKEFSKDYNSQFSDITGLIVVNNTSPYSEFSIGGNSSMLEYVGNLGTLGQRDFENNPQGNITGIPILANVNYSILTDGQDRWYTLIDESVRCSPEFLLPQKEIRNLDIKKPVFVNHLGGFYIIEEIEGYEDESTPVSVKMIKLPSDWSNPADPSSDVESIEYSAVASPPNTVLFEFTWKAVANFSVNNWTGTTLTWRLIEKDSSGTPTGNVFDENITNISSGQQFRNFDILAANLYYETYMFDDNGLISDTVELAVNITQPPITEFITITKTNGGSDIFNSQGAYDVVFTGFVPTNATQVAQKIDSTTQSPIGSPITSSISNSDGGHVCVFDSNGSWRITVTADGYTSNGLQWFNI